LSEALQTIIGEFKKLSPDIRSTVVFGLDGHTLAASEETKPEQTQILITNLSSITSTGCIGGLEKLTIQDVNSQLSVSVVGKVYLATVSSRVNDQKIIKSLTQVVAPAVIQLALKVNDVASETPKINYEAILQQIKASLPTQHEQEIATLPEPEPEPTPEPLMPKAPATQFMVEKIGGLLVASDTVRIDNEVLTSWHELYSDKQIAFVCIETIEGKILKCKFKPQKEGKANTKGTIGIPDKILEALECEKGKLVMVKPVIE
jgi:hypothetical protein